MIFKRSKLMSQAASIRLVLASLISVTAAGCREGNAAPAPAGHGLQVVELFQSQGCSSCPPANRNVMALADRGDVLTLSWQVTYWDYLGWKDSFAQPGFTERQRSYARALGHDGVWTPQVVVNGRGDVVGADAAELNRALRRYDRGGDSVVVALKAGKVVLSGPGPGNATVYVIRYDPRIIPVPVRAGENGGRTLPHRNVVREFSSLGKYSGGAREWVLPRSGQAGLKTAILVQAGNTGPIIAAAHD
jgi:hypothetical protein